MSGATASRAVPDGVEAVLAGPAARGAIRAVPPVFRLERFDAGDFVAERREMTDRLHAARADAAGGAPRGGAELAAMLELAALHLAHGMAPEGLSWLDALDTVDRELPRPQALRRDALRLGLELLDSRDRPLSPGARPLLGEGFAQWPEQPLMQFLAGYDPADPAASEPHLSGAAARIGDYPVALREIWVPRLLDVAVTAGSWSVARDLAAQMERTPRLDGTPAYHYLLGRTAESGGELVTAFDHYRDASGGSDRWAARARLALVELGLRTETLPKADARVLLEQGRRAWSGDAEALHLLQRLARLDLEMGDEVAALEVLATVVSRYAEDPAAALARQQARSLWEGFYRRGAEGGLSLGAFMAGHRAIAPDYRFSPGFDVAAERFADRFLAEGATRVAADEYATIHDYLEVSRDLGLGDVTAARLDALQLKELEALMQGGQFKEAAAVMAEGTEDAEAASSDRRALIRARLDAALGETEALLRRGGDAPSTDVLRLRAGALFERGDWAEAKADYARILQRTGKAMEMRDTIRMLLCAHRTGDEALVLDLADRFPDLRGSLPWESIARSLTEDAPDITPLREAAVTDSVARVDRTLETLGALDRPVEEMGGAPADDPAEEGAQDSRQD